jgi:hypothetical protein
VKITGLSTSSGEYTAFEPSDRVGLAVNFVRIFILEDEEMLKSRRIVLVLPRCLQARPQFVRANVVDERSDRRFHVFDRALVHLIVRGLIDRHETASFVRSGSGRARKSKRCNRFPTSWKKIRDTTRTLISIVRMSA